MACDADIDLDVFEDELLRVVPFLRACARGLTRNPAHADDLVQDAVLRAWASRASFRPGTSMKAWTATILRNQFRMGLRRSWRELPLDLEVAERTLAANDDPCAQLELDDVRRALHQLPLIHREVLMLLAGGLAYEEVAQICGCAQGTIKSRASRARAALQAIIDTGWVEKDGLAAAAAADAIHREIRTLSVRLSAGA